MIISRILVIFLMIAIPLAIIAGVVILQVRLSQKESRWPGLILPIITFGMSLLIIIGIATFSIASTTTSSIYHDARLIQTEAITEIQEQQRATSNEPLEPRVEVVHHLTDYGTIMFAPAAVTATALSVFFLFNIPTAILLIIYALCRGNRRKIAALDMMSLQDL